MVKKMADINAQSQRAGLVVAHAQHVERATGDYVFVVLSPENGQWKGGR